MQFLTRTLRFSLIVLFCVFLSVSFGVGAATLGQTFRLPGPLAAKVASRRLQASADEINVHSRAHRLLAHRVAWSLVQHELNNAVESSALFKMPTESRSSVGPQVRVLHFLERFMLGESFESLSKKDPLVGLWWRIKFEDSKRAPYLLLGIHQLGWRPEHPPTFFFDMGHSVLGLRRIGGDPDEDLVFNPGPKDARTGHETILPPHPIPGVEDMLVVSNLWDWVETQVEERDMRLVVTAMGLTEIQVEALQAIAHDGNHLEWGPAEYANNCAHGAWRLVNTISPWGAEIPDHLLFGIELPASVFARMARRGHFIGKFKIPSPRKVDGPTPSVDYLDAHYGDRSALRTYQKFLGIESSLGH